MGTRVKENEMSIGKRISYAMSGFGGNMAYVFITYYFMYFCTDSLGLSAAIIGTLLMISKLLDGVSDIIMGHIISITHSRFGKARFWLMVCAVPLGICTFLLFYMPAFISGSGSYVYLFVIYILFAAVFYTMLNISATTLLAYTTKSTKIRYSMQTFQSIISILPAIFLSFATTSMVDVFGGGRRGWAITAFIVSVISVLGVLWCVAVVKELPEEELEAGDGTTGQKNSFIESVQLLLTTRYFWISLGCNLAIYISTGIQGAAGVYFCQYILNDASAFGWITMAMYAPLIILIGFVQPLVNKFGARRTNVFGAVLSIVTGAAAFINTHSVVIVILSFFLYTVGMLPSYVTLQPLVAEIAEYTKRKHGKDITAMFYSCTSVGVKVGGGLGTAMAGVILSATGYDGFAEVQSAGALRGITLMFLLTPVISAIILSFLYNKLDVEEVNRRESANAVNMHET